jgi:Na+/melibiose symporter-like transporter
MQASTTTARAGSYRMASTGLFLLAAAASFILSVSLWFSGNEQQGIFVGLWVPSILALGALLRPTERRR